MFRRIYGSIRTECLQLIRLDGPPHPIACGFALGLFVGMSPFMMFHTAMAVSLAVFFRSNKPAAAAGVFITNPVTAPLIYPWIYQAGKPFFPELSRTLPDLSFSMDALYRFLSRADDILRILTVGGIVTGIPVSLAGYAIAYRIVSRRREKLSGIPPAPSGERSGGP